MIKVELWGGVGNRSRIRGNEFFESLEGWMSVYYFWKDIWVFILFFFR